MKIQEIIKSILKIIGVGLAFTPAFLFGGLIVLSVIGALDNAVTKLYRSGRHWVILVICFVLSLIYIAVMPTYRQKRNKRKLIDAIMLHWRIERAKNNKSPLPSEEEKWVSDELEERIEALGWDWGYEDLWSHYYFENKGQVSPFNLMDDIMANLEEIKREFGNDSD